MTFMISQPMGGLSEDEILAKKKEVTMYLESFGNEVHDTYFDDSLQITSKNEPLYYLGYSLIEMANCDAVYFCKGWENYRGCRIEHEAAKAYGLQLMYE